MQRTEVFQTQTKKSAVLSFDRSYGRNFFIPCSAAGSLSSGKLILSALGCGLGGRFCGGSGGRFCSRLHSRFCSRSGGRSDRGLRCRLGISDRLGSGLGVPDGLRCGSCRPDRRGRRSDPDRSRGKRTGTGSRRRRGRVMMFFAVATCCGQHN